MGNYKLEQWSLKEKVGQLFVFGFHGHDPENAIAELIAEYGVGGTIYFTRNVKDARQVHGLSVSLQELAYQAGRPPLFIAIDQEGGMVARLVDGVTLMPGNMALGATGTAEAAYETAKICGEELRKLGITMNYAPCIDVNNNPDNPVINVRSYGDRADLVAELGAAAVKGYQSEGVAATVKHFPGHGDTSVDSHHALPVLPHSMERLEAVELLPFRAAAAAGADLVMTAHVCLPAIDPSGVPSTLSKPVLTGLLREQLGYDGVVVTDCLEMSAIDEHYGPGQGAVKAIAAGADMVLVSHTIKKQRAALEAVVAAVESGELPEGRIDEALRRIMRLKEKLQLQQPIASWDEVEATIAMPRHRAVATKWSESSVTLVKNDGALLPLKREVRTLVLWPDIVPVSVADEMLAGEGTLGGFLAQYGANVVERSMSEEGALVDAEQFPQIIVVTYDASRHEVEREMARAAMKLAGDRVVAVSVRNPLDLLLYPEVKAYVATYECRPLALSSAAKVLLGDLKPTGKLPLEISPAYPFGWSAE